jgi:prepilin-type N-terminal cleavage/methylation domain-containing protein
MKNRGFSLIEVLVALGILGTSIFMAMSSFQGSMEQSAILKRKTKFSQVNEILAAYVRERLTEFLTSPAIDAAMCAAPLTRFQTVFIDSVWSDSNLQIERASSSNLPPVTAFSPSPERDNLQSCYDAAVSSSLSGQSSFKFCLKLSASDPSILTEDDILISEPVYAVVHVALTNFDSHSSIVCESFSDDTLNPSRGLKVLSNLHWHEEVKQKPLGMSWKDFYYVRLR